MATLDELKHIQQIKNEIAQESQGNPEWGFDEDIETFSYHMSLLNPQSYGSRIQGKIAKDLGYEKINSSENAGDLKDDLGNKWEVKASLITPSNESLNMVQIRPWQDIKGYICIALDIRNPENFTYHAFIVSKEQMQKELEMCKATHAHGTKSANEINTNIEMRMSLLIDKENEHFMRWETEYKKFIPQWEQQIQNNKKFRYNKI